MEKSSTKNKAIYTPANNLAELEAQLDKLAKDTETQSVLVLMGDAEKYSSKALEPVLRSFPKTIIGGIFPEIIFQGLRKKSGVMLVSLPHTMQSLVVPLGKDQREYFDLFEANFSELELFSGSLFVFCDALGQEKAHFIESLFNYFGTEPNYLGGGAGSLRFEPFPCVIDRNGLHENAAVIGLSPLSINLGVAHGWSAISEPMKVTGANGNRIESINWEPAFKIYKSVVAQHAGRELTEANFFEIAKSYPLGIDRIDAERVVRDPFKVEGNTIWVVDAISEGEHISIMHGDMASLLEGARKGRSLALNGEVAEDVFCIDCISRVLFMNENFEQEIDVIQGEHSVNGVLTIGEIANSGESILEIYNKTVVVARW